MFCLYINAFLLCGLWRVPYDCTLMGGQEHYDSIYTSRGASIVLFNWLISEHMQKASFMHLYKIKLMLVFMAFEAANKSS